MWNRSSKFIYSFVRPHPSLSSRFPSVTKRYHQPFNFFCAQKGWNLDNLPWNCISRTHGKNTGCLIQIAAVGRLAELVGFCSRGERERDQQYPKILAVGLGVIWAHTTLTPAECVFLLHWGAAIKSPLPFHLLHCCCFQDYAEYTAVIEMSIILKAIPIRSIKAS